ncbi:DNA polymerase III subunit delta [Dethiothermospora halolimnae]|uniref:DNA polymerase III subunit delta n=1 Tax=Dethiothermospora halolimnae TaxID=3114390 RepID=UPI003CCC25E6
MKFKDILNDIKEDKIKPVYLCYGKENFLMDLVVEKIKKKYISENFESLNYITLEGKEIDEDKIINACETLPFMSDKKVVVVKDSGAFSKKQNNGNIDINKLAEYILTLDKTICLIFLVLDEKIDNRLKVVKNIKSKGLVAELNKLDSSELKKWVTSNFKKNKKKINSTDVYYFIQNSGYLESKNDKTLYDLQNEIKKISDYSGTKGEIKKEDIDKVFVKSLENNVFKLLDGISQRKPEVAILILNEMILDNQPIQQISYMIVKQLRLLFMAKTFEEKGYNPSKIVKKLGVHPYLGNKVLKQTRNFTSKELEIGLIHCLEVERKAKTGKGDWKLLVEKLIIDLAS